MLAPSVASAAKLRALVVPATSGEDVSASQPVAAESGCSHARPARISWARLLKRVFSTTPIQHANGAPAFSRPAGPPQGKIPAMSPPEADRPIDPARRHALLPADDALREALHNEVHARPPARITLPALVVHIAVLNEGVPREAEAAHLRLLPGQQGLAAADLQANFLHLNLPHHTLKWERHSEFTRYAFVQPLDGAPTLESLPDLALALDGIDPAWLRAIPGRTVAAVQLIMLADAIDDAQSVVARARPWFGDSPPLACAMGPGHSIAVTDYALRADGHERLLVVAPPDTTPTRAGLVASRLLELETYRLMALRGLPVAKLLGPTLSEAERTLVDLMTTLERKGASADDEQALLDQLVALAARVERATAEHGYRFSATQAYDAIVRQRIDELRERPIVGFQTPGEFMQRRLSPAIATVAATAQRLGALSERIERAGALLRTRVDIATEAQNQQLLEKLTRGQAMQLRLQATVEGLSIAAISYYVVSLILYAGKAGKLAGWPIQPELLAGGSIPLVVLVVAWLTRRIHRKLRE